MGVAGQSRVFLAHLYHDGIIGNRDACKSPAVPPSNTTFIGFQFITDLFPGHVVDIAVTKYHLLIHIHNSLDHASHLLLEVNELVDLGIYFLLQFPHKLKAADEGSGAFVGRLGL